MTDHRGVGVPQLDRLLEPVPERSTLLFLSDPGVEAEPFLYQAAHACLKEGRDVVYVVTNRSPASVRRAMTEYGFPPEAGNAKVRFIDAFSALMGSSSDASIVLARADDAPTLVQAIERAHDWHPEASLIIDSLSNLVDNATADGFLAASDSLHVAMKRYAFTAVLFTKWPYPQEVLEKLSSFDATVVLHAVEDRVTVSQFFRVERASWKRELDVKPRLYKSLKPGGVSVYVPKIVVTGPFNAGKSSFVHAISDVAVSADHSGTTVALDHGRATMDGFTADLFGTPGQARFDPILKIVAGQAVGVILVVDSTQPDSFPRAREMLDLTWRHGLPGIVAANKQDLPGALDPAEVARLLAPPPHVKVVGCSTADRESERRILRELIDQILTGPPLEVASS